jgi:glycosyltransferase involved in cell wall biosynthesis
MIPYKPSDVCVIMPAYNESRTISQVLTNLQPYGYHVVVVDDGSTDSTINMVLKFPVILLHHAVNLGQGAALQTGITYALQLPNIRFIVTFDADGQHAAEDIPVLLEPLSTGEFDIILGSRFIKGGLAENIGYRRYLLLRLATYFTWLVTRLRLTDTHNGIRALTVQAAARISITQNRMAHASDILGQIASMKLRYCERPVKVIYTSYSRGKGQTWLESINILWDIVRGNLR